MAAPTPTEIRDFLECYGITVTILSDAWITARLNNFIIPFVERVTRQKFSAITEIEEYYSGVGTSILFLNRRPVVALKELYLVTYTDVDTRLGIGNIHVIKQEGILKSVGIFENYPYISVFPKGINNLRVKYTYGYSDYPADVGEAIKYLCAEQLLGFVGSRTGGGSLGVQGFNRGYGERGKYQDARNDFARQAMFLLRNYMTGTVGN